jgi:hypothetical protein
MLAKLSAFALLGIEATPVEVEVDVAAGLPKTILVGLPEMAVKESVHSIARALVNLGYQRPTGRTVINLAPTDLRKDAGAFDLPIALGVLVATGQVRPDQMADTAAVGELALDGAVRRIKGALSIALAARDRGLKRLLVPRENAPEAQSSRSWRSSPSPLSQKQSGSSPGNSRSIQSRTGRKTWPPNSTSTTWTLRKSAGRSSPNGRWSSPPPAPTTC